MAELDLETSEFRQNIGQGDDGIADRMEVKLMEANCRILGRRETKYSQEDVRIVALRQAEI